MTNKILGIAINDYNDFELNKVNNCRNDLNAITSILTSKYSFDNVELLMEKKQTTRKFLYNYLYEYFTNSLPTENILLIYTGHGDYNEIINTSYWLPSDSNPKDQSSWININDLLSYIKASKAFHINIISDSCFSGGIFETTSRGGGIKAIENKRSRLALTSGSLEKVSDGIKDGLSPFTEKLCLILSNNSLPLLPFSTLSNELLLSFNETRKQTPMFGSLANIGHEGGAMVFKLKENKEKSKIEYSEISLGLNIDFPFEIDYTCRVPLFSENSIFDSRFVNTFIQQLAFKRISETRVFINEDKAYFLYNKIFYLNIFYTIHTLNEQFLSLSLSFEDYFGGAHPSNCIDTLNIAFKPDRKLNFYDFSRLKKIDESLKNLIDKYSFDNEQKDVLHSYSEYFSLSNIDFSFNEQGFTLYFINQMPSSIMALGFLEIPFTDLPAS